ncbi:MAG: hybrid sensor histidine kinase/response regulator [Clostridium sp.]|nr:response regulator [Clostridiaceae bacterium]
MILEIKRKKKEKRIQIVGALLGICVAATALFYFFHVEKAEAERRMVEIVNYVKVQCSTYTHYNESSESKSLLRAIESARQMSANIDMETENGGQLSREFLKENLQTLWVDGILILDTEGRTVCEYSANESLTDEITDYLQKDIIMDFAGYEERSYSERIARADGSRIDIAACARKDAPGIVAIYYYTSPEFVRNYTLTVQSLLNGYSTRKDGTIIVADKGSVIASNDESLLGQDTAGNEIVQAMKQNTDSRHIFHLKQKGTGCYGIMLKQRDYYIYAYLPDTEVFHDLPLSVTAVVFFYFLIFSVFWFWIYRTNQAHRKKEQEKEEKYKAELLRAAKRADAANEAKTEFLQRMSHDIRTPINGICGMLDVADHYADDMDKQRECRTKIKEASNLLLELVNEVLDMSKLESDEVILEEIPFQLGSIFEELLVVIEQIAAKRNIRIVWEKKEVIHWNLIGSPGYVKRILMNILTNAVKYNRESGCIYISCMEIASEQTGMVTMEFICRDTGIGMTEAFQKRLFEPFAQEHAGSRTKFSGTGLGMSITKKLIEKMGGTITFESELGKGTTFVLRIPFQTDPDVEKREEQKAATERSIKGLKILLAEDNALNMEIAEFMLQNEGACVCKAWNGQQAAEIFENSRPYEFDAILMDIMMPVMNGYEAAERIRSLDREDAKVVPIIAMTANAFTEDRIRAKEAGMDEHIAKPIDVKLLVKVICKLVGNDFMGSCNEKEKVE